MSFQTAVNRTYAVVRNAARRVWFACLCLLLLSVVDVSPAFADGASSVTTGAAPVTLKVGLLQAGWPPFENITDGRLTGLSADYLRALTGTSVTIAPVVFSDMSQLLAAACAGKVDVLMSIARTPEREHCLRFTTPYFRASTSVVINRDGALKVAGPSDLSNARIAIEKGFALERSLRERFPRARFTTYPDTGAALQAVIVQAADVYVGFTPTVQFGLADTRARELRVAFEETGKTGELRFAVPRSQTALRDQLDTSLTRLPAGTEAHMRARWLGSRAAQTRDASPRRLVLTPDEQAWLLALPPLTVGFDSGWPPFSQVDPAGRAGGVAEAYLDYLSRVLGITLTVAPVDNWASAISSFQQGDLAMLATASRADVRLAQSLHTRAYETWPLVIVGRQSEPAARGPADFAGRRIAVSTHLAGSMPPDLRAIPDATMIVVPTLDAALDLVEQGRADVAIGNSAAVDVELTQRDVGALKILATLNQTDGLGFAVRPDLAPLVGLIDRALVAMPASDKQRIHQKWIGVAQNASPVWSITAVRLLPLLIGIAVALLVTLRAYMLLQREVKLRKHTEGELATQLNFQQTMMEMVPYPLVAKDLDGRYIAINRAFEECSGLQRAHVIGRRSVEVEAWGSANTGSIESMTRHMLETGERAFVELEFAGRAGDIRHGLFWSAMCHGVSGKPVCVLGTMVDITDIRRTEMLARNTERRLFDVTRSLPAVVFQLRRDPDGTYTMPYIGGDTTHLVGVEGNVRMQRGEVDFGRVFEDDLPLLLADLSRSASDGTPLHMEFRLIGDEGLKWVRAELVPRREPDGSVVWSGYWVDASVEHARSDELARARDQAEAASRAKDDFLAMMSHEIRTPMNGVLGLVEVLERTPLNADQGEMLGMIHESAGALLQILDDLLDFSKIEAGRLTLEAEPIDIREMVDSAVGLLAGRAHEKGLKVRVDIAPEVAATLRGDSVRLRQILFNLLGNAIKFTQTGEVDVNVTVARDIGARQTLEMTVADTGIGIDPEGQARLFEPFVQAESSTTRRFGGTGLGLTICRKLIDLMDGELTLHSVPGEGTQITVRITMPVEMSMYRLGGLRGKRGVVIVSDQRVAQALVHFGQALGIALRRIAPGAAELDDPLAFANLDLIFVSEDVDLPAAARGSARVVCLTEKPKPTGYRILDDTVRVSINPLSWRGLNAACAAALTGLSTPSPRSTGAAEAIAAPPDRERAIASGRLILVAEDHPVNQELIRHQLALLGFACDVVNDGAEALAALDETIYAFLITDCHMPNLSGYELARNVREQERDGGGTRHLPILGITANTAPEDLRLCRDAGMDDCLVKPTRLATLREYLSRWFGVDTARPVSAVEPEGGGAAPGLSMPTLNRAFVPVDLAHMTQLWGSESTVKALLDSFVTSVRDDVRALAPLLDTAHVESLREWHHRVSGAAGVLQYPPLLAALQDYRIGMTSKSADALREDGAALAVRCNAMLDGIEEQAALLA
ncbi:transporter substrate-binding domain-containing protein [Paraburkholderia sp.]|uniref:ATP-binding protein n=1 Tax=Paraburkholderia sp. TaxID=1926495 RepID=UPI002393D21F|nr:transporter substrate-binding domain-containing protein [Paraburkholderia sp.]MDE1179616.1 transporter substrate-binding domain-containing protein [Paraburkholderia sp.]